MKFGKEIHQAASNSGEWSTYYLDYKSLKQILGQIGPEEAGQSEGDAQLEGLFLSSLLLQIQKVNQFYCDRASQMAEHLGRLAPLITSSALHGVLHSSSWLSTSPRETLNQLAQSPLISHDSQQAVTLFTNLADEVFPATC